MSRYEPKTLRDVTKRGSLKRIFQRAKVHQQINQLLQHALPADIAPHCHLKNYNDFELVVNVDSAAWIMGLRALTPGLLRQLKQHAELKRLKQLSFKVQPAVAQQAGDEPRPPNPLSARSKQAISEGANMIEDAELKAALEHLARK